MPRQARLVIPGLAVHIVQRGNDRNVCFREPSDQFVYLMHLRDLAADLNCAVHAYCLMTNHVHLLVTPPSASACSTLMRNLGQRYVQYFNRHHHRTGTLWEGRFRSCVTDSASYVLACYRYIEMNPVRAGMVASALEYPWSSHAANAGVKAERLITPHAEYLALGSHADARHLAYERLLTPCSDESVEAIRRATNSGYPLIGEELKRTLAVDAKRLQPGKNGRPPTARGKTGL